PPSIPFWGSFATPRSRPSASSKPAPARAILRPSQPRLTNSREPPKRSAPRGSPLQLHCSSAPAKPATTVPAARALDHWRASCAARCPSLMARCIDASLTTSNFVSIPRRHEHVADAPHSADGLRPTRIDLDLAAQPCNPQIDRPIERLHLSVRGDLEQPVPVQRAIGVLGKNSEKIIFARSERFLAAVARIDKDALLEVENPPAQPHARASGWRTACHTPQHALDSGQELARIEWLADIVISTGLKSHDTLDRVGRSCYHDDAKPPTAFAQPPCEHEPILAGEANIEQDDSRQFTLDEPAQCRPAVDASHTEIVFAEVLDQQMALGGLVFDHDDVWPVVRHCDLAPIRTRAKHCRPCPVRQGP